MQMPVPMMNVINGGAHANNNLDMQEFMIVPVGAPTLPRSAALRRRGVSCAEEADRRPRACRPRSATKAVSRRSLPNNEAALQAHRGGDRGGGLHARHAGRASALDCASSEFFEDGEYVLGSEGLRLNAAAVHRLPRGLGRQVSDHQHRRRHGRERLGRLEDPDRAPGRQRAAGRRRSVRHQHARSCAKASREGVANSILIKVNQIGTLTETFAAIEMAKRAGYTAVISHRSGETEDTIIADIAVATNALQIKTGSLSRSDRWPSTTSCCASRKTSATRRAIPGATRSISCGDATDPAMQLPQRSRSSCSDRAAAVSAVAGQGRLAARVGSRPAGQRAARSQRRSCKRATPRSTPRCAT